MTTGKRWDAVLNTVVTAAFLLLVGMVVRRELRTPSARASRPSARSTVPAWGQVMGAGLVMGRQDAPVQIAVFQDLECPYCKRFHESVLTPLLSAYGDNITTVFIHFPLGIHRFARQAAQAVECAQDQQRAAEFVAHAYASQDSIGLIGWGDLAQRSGIGDTTSFVTCTRSLALHPRIQRGLDLGQDLGIIATPTVMVNGIQFPLPPSTSQLRLLVDSLLAAQGTSIGHVPPSPQ